MNVEPSHREVQSHLWGLVDEETGGLDSGAMTRHLETCPECRQEYERYARTVALVRSVPREKAPPGLTGALMRRIQARRGLSRRMATIRHAYFRIPAEMVLPILLAAMLAVLLLLVM